MKTSLQQSLLSRAPQIFLLCCELRNFSYAARALGLTQSAVSKAIQNFENELGFTLFIRNCRPLTLTAEAAELEQFLRHVSGDFSQFLTRIQSRSFIKPVLRVGMEASLAPTLGVAVARELLPDVSRLELRTAGGRSLEELLTERQVDLVVGQPSEAEGARIERRKIFEEPSVLLLPRTLAGQCERWSWKRLALCGLPMIFRSASSAAGHADSLFLRSHGLGGPERIAVDSDAAAFSLVREGMGWTFMQPSALLAVRPLLADVEVAEMQPPVQSRELFLIRREAEFSRETQLLFELCRRVLESRLVPEMLAIAPWLGDGLRLPEAASAQ